MSKTVLEQALDHLLNKEDDKASALLHDYYINIGRKVYEDIMADDVAFDDESEHTNEIIQDSDEVDSDLTEEGDEEELAPEMSDVEATDDLGSEMDEVPASEPGAADVADVADAMLDVESALAKLKAEFEEMASGGVDDGMDANADMDADMDADVDVEEMPAESLEEALELEKVKLSANTEGSPAGAGTGANSVTGATNTSSPVAKRNSMMARPAVNIAGSAANGVPSGTSPAAAPKSQDMGGTTKPAMSKVAKPGTAPGREG